MRITLPLALASGPRGLTGRSGSPEAGRRRRWRRPAGHRGLDLTGQAHQVTERAAGLYRRPHETDGLRSRDSQRSEHSGDLQRDGRWMGAIRSPGDVTYISGRQSGIQRKCPRFNGIATRVRAAGRTQRCSRHVELLEHAAHGRHDPIGPHPFHRAFERFVHEWSGRQATRSRGIHEEGHGRGDGRWDPPGKTRPRISLRDEIRDQQPGQWEPHGAPFHRIRPGKGLTLTTLFFRPNPSSMLGAAGSTIQRSPSTMKAYWC